MTIQTNINFIYVPASSSSEKKNTFSTTAGFLIFSGESLSRGNRSLDKRFDLRFDLPCDRRRDTGCRLYFCQKTGVLLRSRLSGVSQALFRQENGRRGQKAYLVKLGLKSFVDGRQDICKDKESNLGSVVGY